MLAKDLHSLDTETLKNMLSKSNRELEKIVAENHAEQIAECKKDIFELGRLIEWRKLTVGIISQ